MISAKSIVVHFKFEAVHFEVSKIVSMDIIVLKLLSKCKTFLVHTVDLSDNRPFFKDDAIMYDVGLSWTYGMKLPESR